MELGFTVESGNGFNGKASDEEDIEVVVEGTVGNIKRTIGDFAEDYRFEGLIFFLFDGLVEPHSSVPQLHIGLSIA